MFHEKKKKKTPPLPGREERYYFKNAGSEKNSLQVNFIYIWQ